MRGPRLCVRLPCGRLIGRRGGRSGWLACRDAGSPRPRPCPDPPAPPAPPPRQALQRALGPKYGGDWAAARAALASDLSHAPKLAALQELLLDAGGWGGWGGRYWW